LQKIAAAVSGSLGADAAARVAYFQPDQFIAHLMTLPLPVPKDSVTTSHGYKVKRSAPALTDEERRQREELANKMMAEATGARSRSGSKPDSMIPGKLRSSRSYAEMNACCARCLSSPAPTARTGNRRRPILRAGSTRANSMPKP
jgi:hypothetical protein